MGILQLHKVRQSSSCTAPC
uniref:Uncharacterized protein n=1 Tax=Rhizophora mucronata TaxID=61149 RepID=A0A2P2IYM6_RHIMU